MYWRLDVLGYFLYQFQGTMVYGFLTQRFRPCWIKKFRYCCW